ncbi:MAG: Two-component system response regulator TcsR4 [Amycolatopsis sp.]|uniref:response regulator transcription factor n=1 Tax=Amycolatopsis sp. TaxID=37632 RepID=UPI00260BF031|nr:response regulator transcription factor [Amycolatopsis sp.]MCU1681767.1 Two-component system response regulator TcsR4 [Amycolatopsis sp.]
MKNILVVECDACAAESVVFALRRQGYAVRSVNTGKHALAAYREANLVLLSLDLPDIDGLEVCRSMRNGSDIPLIARTHRDDELERVLALREGADDCVAKTSGIREVGARIEAVLRRARGQSPARETISIEPLHIDQRTREVRVHDQRVDVTSKEFELLCTLAAKPDSVVSRKELMASVWGTNWATTSRTIDTHVSSLRSKLGSSRWIITVRGVGYRMGHGYGTPAKSAG